MNIAIYVVVRLRRKGEHMLHAKYVLLMIVILNVVDCLLVLGELMLDIKYDTGTLFPRWLLNYNHHNYSTLKCTYRLNYSPTPE